MAQSSWFLLKCVGVFDFMNSDRETILFVLFVNNTCVTCSIADSDASIYPQSIFDNYKNNWLPFEENGKKPRDYWTKFQHNRLIKVLLMLK